VCAYGDRVSGTSYNIGEFILLFLHSNTWLVSGKSFTAWWWVMKLLLGAGKRQLHWSLSLHALYILYIYFKRTVVRYNSIMCKFYIGQRLSQEINKDDSWKL
jgi:hypothetical protein